MEFAVGLADKILAFLGFAAALYGVALLAAQRFSSLARFRSLEPRWWRGGSSVRAGYLVSFGLFGAFLALGLRLLAAIFAVPAIVLGSILLARVLDRRKGGAGA